MSDPKRQRWAQDLGRSIGEDSDYIYALLQGEVLPSDDDVVSLALALGCDVTDWDDGAVARKRCAAYLDAEIADLTPLPTAEDAEALRLAHIVHMETRLNGASIDWDVALALHLYWTDEQACQWMCGLDADRFPSIGSRPVNAGNAMLVAATSKARQMLALALKDAASGQPLPTTPPGWAMWAEQHRLKVHQGFLDALRELPEPEAEGAAVGSKPDETDPQALQRVWRLKPANASSNLREAYEDVAKAWLKESAPKPPLAEDCVRLWKQREYPPGGIEWMNDPEKPEFILKYWQPHGAGSGEKWKPMKLSDFQRSIDRTWIEWIDASA